MLKKNLNLKLYRLAAQLKTKMVWNLQPRNENCQIINFSALFYSVHFLIFISTKLICLFYSRIDFCIIADQNSNLDRKNRLIFFCVVYFKFMYKMKQSCILLWRETSVPSSVCIMAYMPPYKYFWLTCGIFICVIY